MSDIESIQSEIIEEFSLFDQWMDKYEYIIDLGKELKEFPEAFRTDDRLIKGCQSRVWLGYEKKGDDLEFYADSDAIITKGIIAVLIRVFSGQQPEEIASSSTDFIDKIGLREHLSPTRANGLLSMIKQMKFYALAYQSKAH